MQVEHKTEKGTVTFILPPEDVNSFKIYSYSRAGLFVGDANPKGLNAWKIAIPKGTVLIGLTSEVTEEWLKEVGFGNTDYIEDGLGPTDPFVYKLDSFKSLMQSKKVYEVNPYPNSASHDFKKSSTKEQNDIFLKWHSNQERTGKWIVLFKPNEK